MSKPEKAVREALRQIAGVMTNPVRIEGQSCPICCAPVGPGYVRCVPCQRNHGLRGLADRVVPLTYAVMGEQAYSDMRRYKAEIASETAQRRLTILTALFTRYHAACLDRAAGLPVAGVAVVPSLAGRKGPHPLREVARALPKHWRPIKLTAAADLPVAVNDRREVNPRFFDCPHDLSGRHVVIFEDSWTSGGHAQGAAIRLRKAGAKQVSALVLARILDPRWEANRALLKTASGVPYSLDICPVTGGQCPP